MNYALAIAHIASSSTRGVRPREGSGVRFDSPRSVAIERIVSRDVIGNKLWHSMADRDTALAALKTGWDKLHSEIADALHIGTPPAQSGVDPALVQWYGDSFAPLYLAFTEFHDERASSWTGRFGTSWDAFEAWREKLLTAYTDALAHGLEVANPLGGADLPTTVWQDAASAISKAGSGAAKALGWLKLMIEILVAATGIGLIVYMARR